MIVKLISLSLSLSLPYYLKIFPGDLSEATYPDPNNPETVIGRSEVERREEYIDQLERELCGGAHHPLTQMVKQCLWNSPERRPTTEQLVADLQRVRGDIEGAYGEFAKLDAVRQVVIMKTLNGREAEIREKANEVLAKEEEIHHLQVQLILSYVNYVYESERLLYCALCTQVGNTNTIYVMNNRLRIPDW